jgi:hypothetical protein
MQHKGIILYNFWPRKSVITLLDHRYGKVDAYVNRPYMLVKGALVSYALSGISTISKITNINVEAVPLVLARENLVFIHGLLELTYYSVPHSCGNEDLFSLLWHIFWCEVAIDDAVKNLVVMRILFSTDCYESQVPLASNLLYYLLSLDPAAMLKEQLGRYEQSALQQWIYQCLVRHPNKDKVPILLAYYEALHEEH